jgi:YbgC/YbaW family acyl-CoA thioester hydrolase
MPFETRFMVEWGDCDEAGIVYYPNFLYWMDSTYQRWLRSVGLSQRELKKRYGVVTPVVDIGATFRAPARYDDELVITAEISEWTDRRYRVSYKLSVGTSLIADGFEVRAWALWSPTGIRGAPIEPAFRALLT